MALQKCPRCELNYCRKDQKYCDVCLRELARTGKKKEEPEEDDEEIMCSECGENPVVPGHDLCLECLKEQKRQQDLENIDDPEDSDDDDDFSDSEEDSE